MLRSRSTLVLALALAACSESTSQNLPPLDRFYFPIGIATTRLAGGTAHYVASANYDLRYSGRDGGTLLSVDPVASVGGGALTLRGTGQRIGSYAGPVAVADAATCAGDRAPVALVTSRYDDLIYQFGVGTVGDLTCGPGCVRGALQGFKDPFALAVACRAAAPLSTRKAFVGYLSPPKSSLGSGFGAWITEIDLDDPAATREIEMGDGPVRAMAYDAATDRLWATTQSWGARALLHSVLLSDPRWSGATPREAVDTIDLFPFVHGAELRSIVVGTAPVAGVSRLFLTARLYDAEVQGSSGFRPIGDVGGVLIVLDVTEGVDGKPAVSIRAVESLGVGVEDVAVVRRAIPVPDLGLRDPDLVVATASGEGILFIYDDLDGSVVRVSGRSDLGAPLLGDRPMPIAIDQPSPGAPADVYVAAFGSHAVKTFVLDPGAPSAALGNPTTDLGSIGGLAP
jgi:hypothetical protein